MNGNKWTDVMGLHYGKGETGKATMASMEDYDIDFGPDEHIWEAVGTIEIVRSMKPIFAGITHGQR
jgi:hypothetical protein